MKCKKNTLVHLVQKITKLNHPYLNKKHRKEYRLVKDCRGLSFFYSSINKVTLKGANDKRRTLCR